MRDLNENEVLEREAELAQEGIFDQQLSFPTPFFEPLEPVRTIIKRDGRHVPFDQGKIADAIFRAAQSIGGADRDRAGSLAAGVGIYLMKTLRRSTCTVDQAHDAVEKVLIEMGHARTALAYVRYRDRKARVRKLREGDTRGLMDELAEAQRGRDPALECGGRPLFVQTSDQTIAAWDRDAIARALILETGLDEGTANLIAVEVEQQIATAKVATLTAPLIRELVTAKLIEHGLETHCRRNMRLGVPVYDAARLICGPLDETGPIDPAATNVLLAEAVKCEFALAHVFCRSAARAHVTGDVHLHHLGAVDRLYSSVQSLDFVKRFGLAFPGSSSASHPSKYPETLLAHMVHMYQAVQNHFAGPITWDAFNVLFAPFLQGLDDRMLRQVAQTVVYEFAHQASARRNRVPPVELAICWDIPAHLRDVDAVGPGGEPIGRTYAECAHAAQQFAWALLSVFKDGGPGGRTFAAPVPVVCLTPEFFSSQGHESFLEHVAEAAARRGHIRVSFARRPLQGGECAATWLPRSVVVQRVTLNLPRAAYRSGDVQRVFQELDRLAEVAVRAQLDKRAFVKQLLDHRSLGPLGMLAVERDGQPYFDPDRAVYLVAVAGLNECVQALTSQELHASEDAVRLAVRIAEHLSARIDQYGEDQDIDLVLGQTTCPEVLRRLAAMDLREFPEQARNVVKTDTTTQDISYTPGARLNPEYECSPIERVRIEGQFHEWFHGEAVTLVRPPDDETAKESIAAFVKKAHFQTQSHRIAFIPPAPH